MIVNVMNDDSADAIPEIITLTLNCNDSEMSAMSNRGNDDSDHDGDSSDDDIDDQDLAGMRQKITDLKNADKKRKREMTNLQAQLKEKRQAAEGRVLTKKKITKIKDLATSNTLPIDKQISLNNYFRDVVFRKLKLVTKDVIKSGVVVEKIMGHLQFITDYDKRIYRSHVELALQKQIGQYRDNSVKNIKWKYRTKKGTGPSK